MSITLKNNYESLSQSLEKDFFFIYFNINPHIRNLHQQHDINISNFLAKIKNAKSIKGEQDISSFFLNLYIRLIAFTRDIYYGLGQKTLSYLYTLKFVLLIFLYLMVHGAILNISLLFL